MIVTIDGPAGAGKSTVSRALAERLGFQFLDTGAMYRSVTWAALEAGLDLTDTEAVAALARRVQIAFAEGEVLVDGQRVTDAIREPRVTNRIGAVADNPGVRAQMVRLQREFARYGSYVCEGRDQGTVAFPDAFCKFFLTASPTERAQRRAAELRAAGCDVDEQKLLQEQNERDRQDSSRPVGRLQQAPDAVVVSTDGMSQDEVVAQLESIVRERMVGYQSSLN